MTESYSGYTIYRTTSDSVIKELNDCNNLSSLTVLSCNRFTNANITEALLTNPLERMVISRCPISEIGYIPPSVKYLNLSGTNITNLPKLPVDLRYLDVSNTPLTELPELPDSLVNLNIEGTNIDTLPNIPIHLKMLNVVNTSINVNVYRLPKDMFLIEMPRRIISFEHESNGYECDCQDYPNITRFSDYLGKGTHFKYYYYNLTSDNRELLLNHAEIN